MKQDLEELGASNSGWDVFVSHRSTERAQLAPLVAALRETGLSVWLDSDRIHAFDDIHGVLVEGVSTCKVVLAWASVAWLERTACQWEAIQAAARGEVEDTGLSGRLLLVAPAGTTTHLPDVLCGSRIAFPGDGFREIAARVREVVAAADGPIGPLGMNAAVWLDGVYGRGPAYATQGFVGRAREVWQLHGLARAPGPVRALGGAPSPVVIVSGIGGSGKTALVFEYASRFSGAYPGGVIVLKAARDGPSRTLQFLALAEALGLGADPLSVEARNERYLRARLGRHLDQAGRHLWIVDDVPPNVEEEDMEGWLSPGQNGVSLVTTRSVAEMRERRTLRLGELPEQDALAMLYRYGRPSENSVEMAAAIRVYRALGGHCLALALAAHAVSAFAGFASLAARLDEAPGDTLEEARELAPANARRSGVGGILWATLHQLGEAPRECVGALGVLAQAPIPRPLLHAVLIRRGWSEHQARLAVQQLLQRMVLTESGSPSHPRVEAHALVRSVGAGPYGAKDPAGLARAVVAALLDRVSVFIALDLEVFKELDPHVSSLARKPGSIEEAELARQWSLAASRHGRVSDALHLARSAFAFFDHAGSPTAEIEWRIGLLEVEIGDLHGLTTMGRCFQSHLALHAEDQPESLDMLSSLCVAFGNTHFAREAVLGWARYLRLARRALPQGDPRIAVAELNLGSSYAQLVAEGPSNIWSSSDRRLFRAVEHKRRGHERLLATLGAEDPVTMRAATNLALSLWDVDRLEEAATFLAEALDSATRVLGEHAPETMDLVVQSARLGRDRQHYEEAQAQALRFLTAGVDVVIANANHLDSILYCYRALPNVRMVPVAVAELLQFSMWTSALVYEGKLAEMTWPETFQDWRAQAMGLRLEDASWMDDLSPMGRLALMHRQGCARDSDGPNDTEAIRRDVERVAPPEAIGRVLRFMAFGDLWEGFFRWP